MAKENEINKNIILMQNRCDKNNQERSILLNIMTVNTLILLHIDF